MLLTCFRATSGNANKMTAKTAMIANRLKTNDDPPFPTIIALRSAWIGGSGMSFG
jgi:hypothetical protein